MVTSYDRFSSWTVVFTIKLLFLEAKIQSLLLSVGFGMGVSSFFDWAAKTHIAFFPLICGFYSPSLGDLLSKTT